MPQDVAFDLPFPLRVSADLEDARRRNLTWVKEQGLVASREALDWYCSWDMPRLAAYGFPYAQGPELDLCTDADGVLLRLRRPARRPPWAVPRNASHACARA